MVCNEPTSIARRAKPIALVCGLLMICSLLAATLAKANLFGSGNSPVNGPATKPKEKGQEEIMLASPGRIEGLTEVINVGAGVDGVLIDMRAKEGEKVKAGEVLALLDCRDLEADLQVARAAVESARQARNRLLRGSREEERLGAADETASVESVLKQARSQYKRRAQLFDAGVISAEVRETARRDFEVAEAAHRAAMDREKLVNAPPLPEEIAGADAEVKAAEGRVNLLIARIEKCAVRAPISGTVLKRYLKAGETFSSVNSQPILSLADISRLRVRAEVDERDLGRIHLGQRVVILVDAFPGERLTGRVSSLGDVMGRKRVRSGDPAEKSDRDVLETIVDVDQTDKRLVVGLRVTAQFLGETIARP